MHLVDSGRAGCVRRPDSHSDAQQSLRRTNSEAVWRAKVTTMQKWGHHLWGTVGRHAHQTRQVEGVLLHTLKHGVEDVLPSNGAVQWNKLEKLLINLKGSSNSMNEN